MREMISWALAKVRALRMRYNQGKIYTSCMRTTIEYTITVPQCDVSAMRKSLVVASSTLLLEYYRSLTDLVNEMSTHFYHDFSLSSPSQRTYFKYFSILSRGVGKFVGRRGIIVRNIIDSLRMYSTYGWGSKFGRTKCRPIFRNFKIMNIKITKDM